jgi:GH18 family chitinase
MAMQFWDGNDFQDLKESNYDTYADSVAAIISQYNLDGYDVDYEKRENFNPKGPGNVIPEAVQILQKIRAKLDELSKK